MARFGDVRAVRVVDVAQGILHSDAWAPAKVALGGGDVRHAVLHVLVAAAVVALRAGTHDPYLARGVAVLGVFERQVDHRPGELAHRQVVARIADVVDLPRGGAAAVGDDRHQRVDAVPDIGEGALLLAAVDQLDALAAHDVAEELRHYARAAFLVRADRIQAGADPVERPEQGEIESLLLAVGPDDAVHQLLRAGVDPALAADRAVHQRRSVRVEVAVGRHAEAADGPSHLEI